MKYPTLFTKLINTPWAIASQKLDTLLEITHNGGVEFELSKVQESGLTSARLGGDEEIQGGVAVLNVTGTLVNRTSGFDSYSGLKSYMNLSNEFQSMLDNELVKHIVLDIDSGGGSVNGLFDFVDQIYQARSVKPITAIINDNAFSAAYAIASAASKIYLSRTGGAGSIGVIAKLYSFSRRYEDDKIDVETITAGSRKADLDPDTPISDEARAKVQAEVDSINEMFLSTVERNIGVSRKQLSELEADFFTGTDALDKGLVHEILSPRDAFISVVESTQSESKPKTTLQRRAKAIALR